MSVSVKKMKLEFEYEYWNMALIDNMHRQYAVGWAGR